MSNPLTLIGGQTAFGTAIDNTGTDVFSIYGSGNTITTGQNVYGTAGNLNVFGNPFGNFGAGYAADFATTINIGNSSGVVDQITLDGSSNVVQTSAGASITNGSLVNILFDPLPFPTEDIYPNDGAGWNTVNLSAASSAITVGDQATDPSGNNSATIANVGGVTSVDLTGAYDYVKLTGDVADTVITSDNTDGGAGYATVSVGAADDDAFGNTSQICIADNYNTVFVGDANAMVAGGNSYNTVQTGDGNDGVYLWGGNNSVTVGGGNDTVSIHGGVSSVNIAGVDWQGGPDVDSDSSMPTANDTVWLDGTNDTVVAGDENVTVSGSDGNSVFNLGNGNDNITAGGSLNNITVGAGTNQILLNGNYNNIKVNDKSGAGFDTIYLGAGIGDVIWLDHAAGAIYGTGTGTTWITQSASATNSVSINLNNGTGIISLGDGINIVKANGNFSQINVGDGGNSITALGSNDHIFAGNGDDVIKAGNSASILAGSGNDTVTTGTSSYVKLGGGMDIVSVGGGSKVTVGNGNDKITSNGAGGNILVVGGNGNDTVSLAGSGNTVFLGNGNDSVSSTGGNAFVTVGSGNDTVNVGANSSVFVGANSSSNDTVNVGAGSTVRSTGGSETINGTSNDQFFLNNLVSPSNLLVTGSGNSIALGGNSSANVTLNAAQENDTVTVQAQYNAGPNNGAYSGTVTIANFGQTSVLDLQSLYASDNTALNSFSAVTSHVQTVGGNYELALKGGGAIYFTDQGALSSGQFNFTTNHGLV